MPRQLLPLLVLSLGLVSFASMSSHAQQCSEGPRCKQAQSRIQETIDRMESGRSGISDQAAKGYCVTSVGAEVFRTCAAEFRAMGQESCAYVAEGQAKKYDDASRQMLQTMSDAGTGSGRPSCGN